MIHPRLLLALLIAVGLLTPAIAAARPVHLTCRDGIPPPHLLCGEPCAGRHVRCDVDNECNGVCSFAIRACGEVACADHIFTVPAGQREKITLSTALGAKPTRFLLRCLPHPLRLPCPAPSTTTTVPTTSTTLPGGSCQTDADCDDGNGCTHDACSNGTCVPVCICLGANGVPACCPGPGSLCVATTTTTMPCIPFFQPGCTVTSDCCQPCGPGIIAPCAVCLQGHCDGAP